jgi:1-acyl-sn-glycerol-3-phosphate acyltransferase
MYIAFYWLVSLVGKTKLGIKYDRKQAKELKKNGPYLMVANHCCSVDFLMYACVVHPAKVNFVVSENMQYLNKVYAWFIKQYRGIVRKQYVVDVASIRLMKETLDAGDNLLIFPEGRMSADGRTGYVPPSIGKLVKLLKYPVIIGKTSGAYISSPKWNPKNIYKGGVRIEINTELTREKIEQMSAEEVFQFIVQKIDNNDQVYQQEVGFKLIGNTRAEGLENLLYKCPVCGV